jgi:hypothetical protein
MCIYILYDVCTERFFLYSKLCASKVPFFAVGGQNGEKSPTGLDAIPTFDNNWHKNAFLTLAVTTLSFVVCSSEERNAAIQQCNNVKDTYDARNVNSRFILLQHLEETKLLSQSRVNSLAFTELYRVWMTAIKAVRRDANPVSDNDISQDRRRLALLQLNKRPLTTVAEAMAAVVNVESDNIYVFSSFLHVLRSIPTNLDTKDLIDRAWLALCEHIPSAQGETPAASAATRVSSRQLTIMSCKLECDWRERLSNLQYQVFAWRGWPQVVECDLTHYINKHHLIRTARLEGKFIIKLSDTAYFVVCESPFAAIINAVGTSVPWSSLLARKLVRAANCAGTSPGASTTSEEPIGMHESFAWEHSVIPLCGVDALLNMCSEMIKLTSVTVSPCLGLVVPAEYRVAAAAGDPVAKHAEQAVKCNRRPAVGSIEARIWPGSSVILGPRMKAIDLFPDRTGVSTVHYALTTNCVAHTAFVCNDCELVAAHRGTLCSPCYTLSRSWARDSQSQAALGNTEQAATATAAAGAGHIATVAVPPTNGTVTSPADTVREQFERFYKPFGVALRKLEVPANAKGSLPSDVPALMHHWKNSVASLHATLPAFFKYLVDLGVAGKDKSTLRLQAKVAEMITVSSNPALTCTTAEPVTATAAVGGAGAMPAATASERKQKASAAYRASIRKNSVAPPLAHAITALAQAHLRAKRNLKAERSTVVRASFDLHTTLFLRRMALCSSAVLPILRTVLPGIPSKRTLDKYNFDFPVNGDMPLEYLWLCREVHLLAPTSFSAHELAGYIINIIFDEVHCTKTHGGAVAMAFRRFGETVLSNWVLNSIPMYTGNNVGEFMSARQAFAADDFAPQCVFAVLASSVHSKRAYVMALLMANSINTKTVDGIVSASIERCQCLGLQVGAVMSDGAATYRSYRVSCDSLGWRPARINGERMGMYHPTIGVVWQAQDWEHLLKKIRDLLLKTNTLKYSNQSNRLIGFLVNGKLYATDWRILVNALAHKDKQQETIFRVSTRLKQQVVKPEHSTKMNVKLAIQGLLALVDVCCCLLDEGVDSEGVGRDTVLGSLAIATGAAYLYTCFNDGCRIYADAGVAHSFRPPIHYDTDAKGREGSAHHNSTLYAQLLTAYHGVLRLHIHALSKGINIPLPISVDVLTRAFEKYGQTITAAQLFQFDCKEGGSAHERLLRAADALFNKVMTAQAPEAGMYITNVPAPKKPKAASAKAGAGARVASAHRDADAAGDNGGALAIGTATAEPGEVSTGSGGKRKRVKLPVLAPDAVTALALALDAARTPAGTTLGATGAEMDAAAREPGKAATGSGGRKKSANVTAPAIAPGSGSDSVRTPTDTPAGKRGRRKSVVTGTSGATPVAGTDDTSDADSDGTGKSKSRKSKGRSKAKIGWTSQTKADGWCQALTTVGAVHTVFNAHNLKQELPEMFCREHDLGGIGYQAFSDLVGIVGDNSNSRRLIAHLESVSFVEQVLSPLNVDCFSFDVDVNTARITHVLSPEQKKQIELKTSAVIQRSESSPLRIRLVSRTARQPRIFTGTYADGHMWFLLLGLWCTRIIEKRFSEVRGCGRNKTLAGSHGAVDPSRVGQIFAGVEAGKMAQIMADFGLAVYRSAKTKLTYVYQQVVGERTKRYIFWPEAPKDGADAAFAGLQTDQPGLPFRQPAVKSP